MVFSFAVERHNVVLMPCLFQDFFSWFLFNLVVKKSSPFLLAAPVANIVANVLSTLCP